MSTVSTQQLGELRDRSRKLSHLIHLTTAIGSSTNINEILQMVMSGATEAVNAELSTILLLDEKETELRFAGVSWASPSEMGELALPIETSLAGRILSDREPLVVHDPDTVTQEYLKIGPRKFTNVKSLLGVPMVLGEKPIGIIEVMNKRKGTFSESDTEVLLAFASIAAVAVENQRLKDQLKRSVHQDPVTSSSTLDWWERLSPRHYVGLALAGILLIAGVADIVAGLATSYHLLPWITDALVVMGSITLALETILLVQD